MKNRSGSYWERRVAQRMVDYMAEAERTANDLGRAYYAASESMKDDMHRIFGNFQKAFDVSEAEAKQIFASVGNDSAMAELKKAAMKILAPEKRQAALDVLDSAPAYTWRIARLDDLLGRVSDDCNRIYKTELRKTTDFLGEITKTAYKRGIYDLQVGTGTVGAAFDLIPDSRIRQILKMNWSGKNYSKRIYADVSDMGTKLKQTLLESMFTGESEHKIAEKVAQRWQIGFNDARQLIRTETNYVSNQAELESYRSAGIKEYIFTAVLDSRTSEICAELDGKKFPVVKAKPGVNLPPMHPYCRSTTVADIPEGIWHMSDEELDAILDEDDGEEIPFNVWESGLKEVGDGKVRFEKNLSGAVDFFGNGGIMGVGSDEVALEYQRYGRNKSTIVNKTYIDSGEYRRKFDAATDNPQVNKTLYDCAKKALKHRSGTELEDMYWIDGNTGSILLSVTDSIDKRAIVYSDKMKKAISGFSEVVTLHTHPSSMPPSASDLNSCYRNKYKIGIIACHDGKIFGYTSNEIIGENLYIAYVQRFIKDGNDEYNAQIKALERLAQSFDIEFWEVI